MYKIFIVEDDMAIRSVLERTLAKWGYMVRTCGDFRAVSQEISEYEPHLVLLDISLPFFDGYHWCAEVRRTSQVPIIFISSANDDMNLVMAINLGADDYITKPFKIDVLIAKIQAILRRAYSFGADVNTISFGDVSLNLGEGTLIYAGKRTELSKNEMRIVRSLIEARGNLVTRDDIIRQLWDDESFIDDNTLSVNIARLRKKLSYLGLSDFISTKKGIGYFLKGEKGQ